MAATLDLLRVACWYAFMLMLLPRPRRGGALGWLRPLAVVVLLVAMLVIYAADKLPDGALARPQAFAALAMATAAPLVAAPAPAWPPAAFKPAEGLATLPGGGWLALHEDALLLLDAISL
jgi:hypothetical protein